MKDDFKVRYDRFGGEISIEDFNTSLHDVDVVGEILDSFKFDNKCRRNLEKREQLEIGKR